MTSKTIRVYLLAVLASMVVAAGWWSTKASFTRPSSSVVDYSAQIFVDADGGLGFEEVRNLSPNDWTTAETDKGPLSLGYSDSAYWIKLAFRHAPSADDLLVIDYPLLDYVDLYQVSGEQLVSEYHVGDMRHFDNRPIETTAFSFPLFSTSTLSAIYLRVQSKGTLKVPLSFEDQSTLVERAQTASLFLGTYLGYMFLMIVTNLVLSAVADDKNYLLYAVYVFGMTTLNLNLNGVLFHWVWPQAPEWNPIATNLISFGTVFFQLVFVCRYLQAVSGWMKGAADTLRMLAVVGMLTSFVPEWYSVASLAGAFLVLASNLLAVAISLNFCLKREKRVLGEIYFAVAWVVMAIGIGVVALGVSGVLPATPMVNNAGVLASLLEVFFLSAALADRYEKERQARIDATLQSRREAQQRQMVERHMLFQATHESISHLPKKEVLLENWPKLREQVGEEYRVNAVLIHFEGYYQQVLAFGQEAAESLVHSLHESVRRLVASQSQYMTVDVEWNNDKAVVLDTLDLCLILVRPTGEDITKDLENLQLSLSEPQIYRDMSLEMDITIGVSQHLGNEPIRQTIRRAQVASKEASQRRLKVLHYRNKLGLDPEFTTVMMSRLKVALEQRQLKLAFQPQINTYDGSVFGVEALIRWRDEEYGQVSPETFIPIAEQSSMITALTHFVVDEACAFYQRFEQRNGHGIRVSINLSARNLADDSLIPFVSQTMDKYRVPASMLTFEVTETAIMGDLNSSRESLEQLVELGVNIALDDFGTGYSSLVYLKELPFSELKIDKGFLLKDAHTKRGAGLIRAAVQLGTSLGMTVIAEGVETNELARQLADYHCVLCQGYHYGRPMHEPEFEAWYKEYDNKRNVIGRQNEITH